jgi:WD40 repeat protein
MARCSHAEEAHRLGHGDRLLPGWEVIASADRNGGLQIWEGETGKEFNSLAGHKGSVTGLGFMSGVVASASEDGTIKLWDSKEGKE